MAIIGFIVMGDRTSHGGVVMSGDPTWTVDGQPIASQDEGIPLADYLKGAAVVGGAILVGAIAVAALPLEAAGAAAAALVVLVAGTRTANANQKDEKDKH